MQWTKFKNKLGKLRVAANHRYLEFDDGAPFFYLGDTAWELFHRLNREEAQVYLSNRAAKGFTVIQAVALAELGGTDIPNPYGDLPLIDRDPTRPNEGYFRHVDQIVHYAEEVGLFIGMLPGDHAGNWTIGIPRSLLLTTPAPMASQAPHRSRWPQKSPRQPQRLWLRKVAA